MLSPQASQNEDHISQPSLPLGVAHDYAALGYVLPPHLFCFTRWLEYGRCHEPSGNSPCQDKSWILIQGGILIHGPHVIRWVHDKNNPSCLMYWYFGSLL